MAFFGEEEEANQPLWFQIEDVTDQNHIQNLKFRDSMLLVNKFFNDVSETKILKNENIIIFKSLRKHRETFTNINSLGNIPCQVKERIKLNCVKGTIHHPSLAETNEAELLEDLRKDNKNIAEVFIFKKFNPETKDRINTANAVITFDAITLPSQIIYLKYNILKTRLYYPNPVRCQNCYKYGHYHSRDRPCNAEKVCGNCGEKYHLNDERDKCRKDVNCSNCNGPHEAWSRKCPTFMTQKRIIEIMTDNRCPFKEAERLYEKQDNRKGSPMTYSQVTTVKPNQPNNDIIIKKIQENSESIQNLTIKMEQLMSAIIAALPHLGQPVHPPGEWLKSQMNTVEETDSAGEMDEEEDDFVPATPNQPTVQGLHYYTADYTNRGNNNPPAQHNRPQKRQSEKLKEKDKKKKRGGKN